MDRDKKKRVDGDWNGLGASDPFDPKRRGDGFSYSIPKIEDCMVGSSNSPSLNESKGGFFIPGRKAEFVGGNTLTGCSYIFLLNQIWKIGDGFLLLEEEVAPALDFQLEVKRKRLETTSKGKGKKVSCDEKEITDTATIGIPTSQNKSSNRGEGRIFFNFEGQRLCAAIRKCEIWAMYDEYGMPRSYVEISTGNYPPSEGSDGKIHVDLLRSNPMPRKAWYNNSGYLCPYGMFSPVCHLSFTMDLTLFSHKLNVRNIDKTYFIYPRKGEVWAVITGINTTPFQMGCPTIQKYQMVEILEDYSYVRGIKAVYLVRVKGGYRSLFRRRLNGGGEVTCQIPSDGLKRFSHQVPSFKVTSEEEALSGCLELDPSSLPLYIDDFVKGGDPEINDNFLCLGFLDFKISKSHDEFTCSTLWAAYDDKNRLPVNYIVTDPKVDGLIHILEPCPISGFQRRWYEAGLPIACGFFRIIDAKSKRGSHSMVSHKVHMKQVYPPTWTGLFFSCYHIYPVVGDVWGIYKDCDMRGVCNHGRIKDLRYKIVEITGEFSEERGVKVVYLVRVEGFKSLFTRKTSNGKEVSFVVAGYELHRFSHQIPAYRFNAKQRNGIPNGSHVLDPLLVPEKEGHHFTLGYSSLLDRSICQSPRFAIQHFMENEKNRIVLNNKEKTCQQSEVHTVDFKEEISEDVEAEEVGIVGDIANIEEDCINKQPIVKLYDFDGSELEISFNLGEIWALYDEFNGLPHSYARINKFIPSEGKVEVTQLEPHPMAGEEMQWIEENLPLTCGTFRASKSTCIKEFSLFSHRVTSDEGRRAARLFYRIFPGKGEIWAIYKNWDASWTYSDLENNLQYKLVEVVSDFTEEAGVTVAALVRVEGHEDVFKRDLKEGFGLFKTFSRKELLRFSHCIPARRLMGDEGDNTSEGLLKIKFTHQGI